MRYIDSAATLFSFLYGNDASSSSRAYYISNNNVFFSNFTTFFAKIRPQCVRFFSFFFSLFLYNFILWDRWCENSQWINIYFVTYTIAIYIERWILIWETVNVYYIFSILCVFIRMHISGLNLSLLGDNRIRSQQTICENDYTTFMRRR